MRFWFAVFVFVVSSLVPMARPVAQTPSALFIREGFLMPALAANFQQVLWRATEPCSAHFRRMDSPLGENGPPIIMFSVVFVEDGKTVKTPVLMLARNLRVRSAPYTNPPLIKLVPGGDGPLPLYEVAMSPDEFEKSLPCFREAQIGYDSSSH